MKRSTIIIVLREDCVFLVPFFLLPPAQAVLDMVGVKERLEWADLSEILAIKGVFCAAAWERIQNLAYTYLLFTFLQ